MINDYKSSIPVPGPSTKLGKKNPQGKTLTADAKNVILYQYDSYIENGYSPINVRKYIFCDSWKWNLAWVTVSAF